MNLSLLPYLKDFAVGNDSFRLCSGFCVRDHDTLCSIIVGSYSFIGAVAKRKSSRNAFVFAIENCPSLRTVHIRHHSFFHCSVYLLSSCSRRCVWFLASSSLDNLLYAEYAFHEVHSVTISSTVVAIPLIRSLECIEASFFRRKRFFLLPSHLYS